MDAAQATSMNKSMMCEDILLLILCLLPPEASARLKSVCRYWNRLISTSSYLQSLHKYCVDSKRVIGFYHGTNVVEKLQFGKLTYEDNEHDVRVVSSHLVEERDATFGLKVCATCDEFFLLDCITKLILRNPLTKTDVRIDHPPHPPPYRYAARLIYFGLDVSSSSEQGGDVKLVFKILNICIGKELESSVCSIYSSLTGTWMLLEMDDMVLKQLSSPQSLHPALCRQAMDPYPNLNPVGAIFLKRSLHWLFDDGRIFAFDLEEQTWRHIETPAARGRKQGELGLIKNHYDIIYATAESSLSSGELLSKSMPELVNKLCCYLYPNIWFGLLGEHIYLLLVIDETNLQLWVLDNYEEVEWRIIADIKNCGFVAPLLFDGRRIFVADFGFDEWKNKKCVVRFFDIFTRKWLPTSLIISDTLDQFRFFSPMICPRSDS